MGQASKSFAIILRQVAIPLVVLLAIAALGQATGLGNGPQPGSTPSAAPDRATRELTDQLLAAVNNRRYQEVVDQAPPDDGFPRRIHQMPNLDLAVIELDAQGSATSAADVLFSPKYPTGVSVPLDRNLHTDQVRWRWWDDQEWDQDGGQGSRDVLTGREKASLDFTSPYPASVFKLMVGFGVLRLVDRGGISLDENYSYDPEPAEPDCGDGTTAPVRQFFDEMITISDNSAACALIKLLHDHHAVDSLNQTFSALGLETLKMLNTDPDNGYQWSGSNMSALDTAKLLLLINGGPGTLWTAPNQQPVTQEVLSTKSRAFFLKELGEQAHNEMLSTTNWCGRSYPASGIPQTTASRWINQRNGTMMLDDTYGQDVRPCNTSAEVTFAHKTGWVDTSGSDAGIVHSLPGKPARDFIVVLFSNLGTRYTDPNRPDDPAGSYPVPYTQKHAQLGAAIDRIMRRRRS
jgi:CubicO group peptidase (beta-lactamase class C family)